MLYRRPWGIAAVEFFVRMIANVPVTAGTVRKHTHETDGKGGRYFRQRAGGGGHPEGRSPLADAAQPNEQNQRGRLRTIQISGILWRARSLGRRQEKRPTGVSIFKSFVLCTLAR
jgi:hypothetical protein